MWKKQITTEAGNKHREKPHNECYKNEHGEQKIKAKTASIVKHISQQTYVRKPSKELLQCSKQETKKIMIARYRMLECGQNLKGSMKETCTACGEIDNEDHRLNYCKKYKDVNLYDDIEVLRGLIPKIENT